MQPVQATGQDITFAVPLPPSLDRGHGPHHGHGAGHLLGGGHRVVGRDRSPSLKRKLENGEVENIDREEQSKSTEYRNRSRSRQRQCVIGTSNNTVQVNRKMRSPPADIFVWGVHPDTSIQDIVADLGDSGIVIQEKDVEKKSKEEAYLVSYRIRLKAEDLQKALDPGIWPMRVKVREYIYYSKNPRQQRPGGRGEGQGHPHGGNAQHNHGGGGGQTGVVGERGQLPAISAINQYSVLQDNASGDSPHV